MIFNFHFNTEDFQISIFGHNFFPVLKIYTFNSHGFLAIPPVLPKLDSPYSPRNFYSSFILNLSLSHLYVIICPWNNPTILDFSLPSNTCILIRSCLHGFRASLNSFPACSLAFLKFRDLLKLLTNSIYIIHFIPIIISTWEDFMHLTTLKAQKTKKETRWVREQPEFGKCSDIWNIGTWNKRPGDPKSPVFCPVLGPDNRSKHW